MILESLSIIFLALLIDLTIGDPKNKFHPTAWIGQLIAKLTPLFKNSSDRIERLGGVFLILSTIVLVTAMIVFFHIGITLIATDLLTILISVILSGILLKTTIAIRGMERHSLAVLHSIENNDINSARDNLSMIVKRKTNNLDKNHIFSGVIESISENTVDGITGPLFYYGLFGLPGAFVYRVVNTADSMIGYKTKMFKNIGWFAANCDKILNYLPARLTGLTMILSAMILGHNWKNSYKIMLRDGKKTSSPNAGYPMAAIAGALDTKFEKINYYSLGDGDLKFSKYHLRSAISMMKVTSLMFTGIVVVPLVILLSYFGWWIHA